MITCSSISYTLCVLCVFYVCVAYSGVSGTVCHRNGVQHVENADVRFGLMLQLRDHGIAPNDCQISDRFLQHYLTVEWILEKINSYNNGTGYIPGVKIGYTSYDDCGEPVYSARNSISFLNDSLSYMSFTCEGQSQTLSDVAIIGPSRSSSSMGVSSLIKDYQIPIISPMSTVTELSDKTLYPTFFRTVPSDEHHMSLIVDVLDELRWTYISVVYQNDDYGQSARRVLDQKAKDKGICIHSPDLSLPQDDDVIGDHFEHVLETARENSIAVVVIADSVQTEQLLYAVETRVQRYKRGLHFILTNAVNLDVNVFKNKEQGQGTLSFSTPSELLNLEDLKAHINGKFEEFDEDSTGDKHPLIKEYVETFGKPAQAFVPKSLDSFLPSTINAVMALVESLKTLHNENCGAVPGPCPKLNQEMRKGELLNHLKNVQVTYSSIPKAVVPVHFHESQVSFSFDAHGDLQFEISKPSFTIHSYGYSNEDFNQVGSYVNGNVQLDISKIEWLSPSGIPLGTGYNPNSMCAEEQCVKCRNNDLVPIMHLPGEVYIVGIFSLHETDVDDPFKCGAYRNIANDAIAAEGFLYSVKELEAKTGIKFGAIAFDACYSQLRITSILTDFFSDNSPLYSQLFPVRITRDRVAGVIGCLSSGCTIVASRFFTPLNIPVISYAATSPDLDDIIDFPYFMRTVPSDIYQAHAMFYIIREMGWEYVGLLYVDNNYGAKGMRAFRNLVDVKDSRICAAKEIAISDVKQDDDEDLIEATRKLSFVQNVKVVVFFGTDSRARDFVRNMDAFGRYGKFIFLASEDWGVNEGIKNAGPSVTRGSITLKLQTIGLESEDEFRAHLQNKKPSLDDTNVWFREFLEARNNCHFRGSFHSENSRECDPDQGLSPNQVIEGVTDQRTRHTMNAVYAMGRGLNETIKSYCKDGPRNCIYLKSNPKGVVEHIKKQKRLDRGEKVNVFDPSGNGAIGYNVYSIQLKGSTYGYEEVGEYGPRSKRLRASEMRFYDKYGTEQFLHEAVCEEDLCNHCQHKLAPEIPIDKEATGDNSCSDFKDSDILLISLVCLLILAVAVAVVAFCICYRKNCSKAVMVKSNGNEDRTYEQIRQIYPGQTLPQSANLQFSDPNISPYVLCNTLNRQGVSNPTFLSDSDRLDSVSQAVRARAMNIDHSQYGSTTSGNITTNQNSIQSVAPSTPSSRPPNKYVANQRRMAPTDVIGESENGFRDGNQMNSSIKYVNDPPPGIQRQSSVVYSALAAPSLPLNVGTLQATQNSIYNRDSRSDVVFAKDANGKLVAYVASTETVQSASSLSPHLNDASQTASAQPPSYYGPYSYAAALQKQSEEQGQGQTMPAYHFMGADVPAAQVNDPPRTPYEDVELQNLNFVRQDSNNYQTHIGQALQQQQQQQQQLFRSHQPGNQDFPVQYATPTHIISTPNSYSTAIPMHIPHLSMIQQQSILQQQQQQSRPFSEPTSTTQLRKIDPALHQRLIMAQHPNHQMISSDDQFQPNQSQRQGGTGEEDVQEPQRMKDEVDDSNLHVYPGSDNSLSSIPDLVSGQMPQQPATPLKSNREIELESIDLDTDSEQELNKNQQNQYTGKHGDTTQQNTIVTSVV